MLGSKSLAFHAGMECGAIRSSIRKYTEADLKLFELKPGAVVVSARRAGTTATLDQMNKYLLYTQMPVVSSRYWNMVHGQTPDQVLEDTEGVQIMRVLGKNMAWLLKSIEAGRKAGITQPEKEQRISTNYLR